MDDRIREALAHDRTIDITTTGRTSGRPRRIETWLYRVGDRFFLTGSPGRRDWYANLLAEPRLVVHLKQSVAADLPARAAPIIGPAERRALMAAILAELNQTDALDAWVVGSPLVEVEFGAIGDDAV